MVTEQVTKMSSIGSLPSVNASKIDWPNESTEMHWPSVVCKAQGFWGPSLWGGGSGQGHSEEEAVTSSWEDQGRPYQGGGIWVRPGRMRVEPSPSALAL